MDEKNNKEKLAILVGFLLIIAVVVLTFFRSSLFPTKKNQDSVSAPEQKASYKIIYPKNLQQRMSKGEIFQIIDIRPFEKYSEEHILDSLNMPPEEISFSNIETGRDMVLVTEDFQYEFLEALSLDFMKKGAKSIMILFGGINEWKSMGGPTVTYGNPEFISDQSKVAYISQEDFKKRMENNESLFLLDVRLNEAFKESHLPKASNIPLYELERRRNEIPSSKIIIVYSDIEIEAFQAAVKLYDIDFTTSLILKGGLSEWTKSGGSVEK